MAPMKIARTLKDPLNLVALGVLTLYVAAPLLN